MLDQENSPFAGMTKNETDDWINFVRTTTRAAITEYEAGRENLDEGKAGEGKGKPWGKEGYVFQGKGEGDWYGVPGKGWYNVGKMGNVNGPYSHSIQDFGYAAPIIAGSSTKGVGKHGKGIVRVDAPQNVAGTEGQVVSRASTNSQNNNDDDQDWAAFWDQWGNENDGQNQEIGNGEDEV